MKLNGEQVTKKWLAGHLEHVIWDNDEKILHDQVTRGIEYGFRTIYSPSVYFHEYVTDLLKGTGIRHATPVNFKDGLAPGLAIAKHCEIIEKMGVDTIDLWPDMAAYGMRNWKALTQFVKDVRSGFSGEIKVLLMANDSLEDMYRQVEAYKEGGADFVKAYDSNKVGCPMHRVRELRKKCDEVGIRLKTSGNGKYWTNAIVMGNLAAGAEAISASNTFQIVDDLPIFEELYSKYEF